MTQKLNPGVNKAPSSSFDALPGPNYFLGQSQEEINRLNAQYQILKSGFGHNDPLDLPLRTTGPEKINILDVGTGTGAWILDVARIPQISARLSGTNPAQVGLYACDITGAKLPSNAAIDAAAIKFFIQDVTKPFPKDMYHTFDLVHSSLLCFALTEGGWEAALKNIHDLLKPGGYLIVMEYDIGMQLFDRAKIWSEEAIYDMAADLNTRSSIINRINSIILRASQRNGFVAGLAIRLGTMLKSAGFQITSRKHFDLHYGIAGKSTSADYNQAYGEAALDNLRILLDIMSRSLLSQNDLEIPQGTKITSEVDRTRVLKELIYDIENEGYFGGLSEWVAWRPL